MLLAPEMIAGRTHFWLRLRRVDSTLSLKISDRLSKLATFQLMNFATRNFRYLLSMLIA
jgi:hypothetical protein